MALVGKQQQAFCGFQPAKMRESMLPETMDVLRHVAFIKQEKGSHVERKIVVKLVAADVREIWEYASVPTVGERCVQKRVGKLMDDAQKAAHHPDRQQAARFRESLDSLFDICNCQCDDLAQCSCNPKFPRAEIQFLRDQRGPRRMMVGREVDVKESARLARRQKRLFGERKKTEDKSVANPDQFIYDDDKENASEDFQTPFVCLH